MPNEAFQFISSSKALRRKISEMPPAHQREIRLCADRIGEVVEEFEDDHASYGVLLAAARLVERTGE